MRYPRVDGHAIPNVTIYAPVTVTPAAPVEIKPGSYDDAYVAPGDEVTVNLNYEANLPKGTQYSLVPPTGADADWEIAVDEETGRVIAKAPANAPSGRHSFKVIAKTPQPNSQEFEIDLNIHVDKQINGSDLSSGDGAFASLSSQSCVAAGLTVGLPLLFLIPVGLATQVNIPGLSPIVGQIQKELGKINSQAQQKLGIFDSQWADIARQLNLQSSNAGQVAAPAAGAIALVAAGLLVSDYLLKNCTPESTGLSAR
ncbi:MAG: Rib/alpha-like domain-containing protein [Corynebacterium sp.]|nr:Rib/alpha-like domain-containing protein [Corynebacterium sp.]